MKFKVVKNTAIGRTHSKDRDNAVGNNLSDPFLDSYDQEVLVCCDILDRLDRCETDLVNILFSKKFLRRIVRSHVWQIREIQKGINCQPK